jgi:plastocyanin
MLRIPALLIAIVSLVVFGAAACGDDDDDSDEDVAEGVEEEVEGGDADLEITTTDNQYSADTLTAPADTEVTLRVTNDGSTLHNWIVPEEEVTMDLVEPGEEGEVTFRLPAGEYEYLCEAHPTEMTGTLVVE